MFDEYLRVGIKDPLFRPLASRHFSRLTPNQTTLLAFVAGIGSCVAASRAHFHLALGLWMLNRALDCLDGALARSQGCSTELGGFLDILGDFIVYSLLPIAVRHGINHDGSSDPGSGWRAVALLEASFHVNNVVLFYAAAVAAKRETTAGCIGGAGGPSERDEVTTAVVMRPALIEGFEAAAFFTAMLIWPHSIDVLATVMAIGVCIGTIQRLAWLLPVLRGIDDAPSRASKHS